MRSVLQCLPVASLLVSTVLTGCSITINSSPPVSGSGVAKTENRTVDAFSEISVAIGIDVKVTCGEDQSLTITADDNLVPLIKTRVANGVLHIESDHNLRPQTDMMAEISVPSLSGISLAGAGDISVTGMETTEADISISGSGSVTGDLQAASLDVSVAGAGDIELSGAVKTLDVSVAGSGELRLLGLAADDVSISVAGSGDVAVDASSTLDISIAGSGDVTYSGDAKVSQSVFGSGNISRTERLPRTAEQPE